MVVESVKVKIYRKFITCFLCILGKKYPEFVEKIIDQLCNNPIHRKIIKARYIDGVKFESISDYIGYATSTRNIFIIHKNFIGNLVTYVISGKINSL